MAHEYNRQQYPIVSGDQLYELTKTAKLDKDERFRKLIIASALTNDAKLTRDLLPFIQTKAAYELLQKFPFPAPSESLLRPDLSNSRLALMGRIQRTRVPFAYPTDLLNQHALILGATGTGKTNLLYGIALQVMRQGTPVWMIDKDKLDYRHLRRFNPDLLVLDAQEDLVINPWQPPKGVPPKSWRAKVIEVFCKTGNLLDGSEGLLIKALSQLYEERGVFQGSEKFPTTIDLYEKILSYKIKRSSRNSNFRDSIINRLEAQIALVPRMCEYSKGFPIDKLAERSVVLEVKGLTERIARFVINIPLYALFQHRIATGQRGNRLRNLVIVDEAKYLAPPGFNEKISFTPLTYILSQVRDSGIGCLLGEQTAMLENSVFVNSIIKICFRLGDGQDIEDVRKSMSLTKEQAEYLTKLGTGKCIVRIPEEDPFCLETLKVNLE